MKNVSSGIMITVACLAFTILAGLVGASTAEAAARHPAGPSWLGSPALTSEAHVTSHEHASRDVASHAILPRLTGQRVARAGGWLKGTVSWAVEAKPVQTARRGLRRAACGRGGCG